MAEGDAKLFLLILTFFAVWTGFVGFVNMSSSGAVTLSTLSTMTGTIPGQSVPNMQIPGAPNTFQPVTEQDYTTSNGVGWSSNYTKIKGGFSLGPLWTQVNGVGFTCTNTPLIGTFSSLIVNGEVPSNNTYTVTYTLDPNGVSYFYTILYEADPEIPGESLGYDSNGVSLFDMTFPHNPIATLNYPGANQAHTIKTVYNQVSGQIDVTIDNNFVGTIAYNMAYAKLPNLIYAGLKTDQVGIAVEKIETNLQSGSHASGDWIQGFEDFLSGIWAAATAFWSIVSSAIGLTKDAVLPVAVWAIIGLPAIATLIYLGLKLIRGTS